MMIILSGNTRQTVDFKPYNVKAKEILVISKGCLHQGDPKERVKGFTIIFAADFFSTEEFEYLSQLEIFNASYNSSRIAFDAGNWSKIMTIFTALKQEHFRRSEHQTKARSVSCCLHSFQRSTNMPTEVITAIQIRQTP